MSIPRATYRLQFREGMTFDRAAELVPYLADLGISHLYASPIFAAAPGSTHGYDVADHQRLDPDLGGEEGFARMAEALKAHGLGLILDIVPNHMAVSTANPWWKDVLRWGAGSPYAGHFDIDWSAPKLLLPVLGEPYGEALSEGKLSIRWDAEAAEFCFTYYDLALPLAPASVANLLRSGGLADLASTFDAATPETAADLPQLLKQALNDEKTRGRLNEAANADKSALHEIHEAQAWRLAYWRLAREALTYRRFFEIAELIGVRVEDEKVFADVHRLPLQLVQQGIVDGLRIDHIDGLADPKDYLERLRAISAPDYVLVEKILGPGEDLRADWKCVGTTGYEVGKLITGVQVDRDQRNAMTEAWTGFTGDEQDFARQVAATKRHILTINLAGELEGLVEIAYRIAQSNTADRDFGRDALRLAVVEIAAALPVYRTYVDRDGPAAEDRALIESAVTRVDRGREVEDERVIQFVASLLLGQGGDSSDREEFVRRFQQTTGPLTAKAVEDTVFYRFNRLIALNEVGAEPDEFGVDIDDFHQAMRQRATDWPHAMSATATHDTKRGEDARARLAVLSEMPEEWSQAVRRWRDAAAALRETLPHGPAPGLRAEWLLYQAIAGAWPPELLLDDEDGLAELAERLVSFMTKALREAKRRTSWTDQNEPFEAAVEAYVRELFSPERRRLLHNIRSAVAALEPAGMVNTLAQLALKLTVPGVPDIYQGCELLDHSMVDPDNRRPVDFDLRRQLLGEVRAMQPGETMLRWKEGLPKLWLLDRLLDLRRRRSTLFERGGYEPVAVEGEGASKVIAFSRSLGGETLIVAAPRLVLRELRGGGLPAIETELFTGTFLRLPRGLRLKSTLDAAHIEESAAVSLANLWRDFPVAVLETDE